MIDLKAKPFYLSDDDITWVHETLAGMSTEEKRDSFSAYC